MTRRIANVLIVAVMAVTILRAGSVISVDDAAEFWFVGYMAAFVFDAFILFFMYGWQRARGKARRVYLSAVFVFSALSWFYQGLYLVDRTGVLLGILKSAPWPLALVYLAVYDGIEDDKADRAKPETGVEKLPKRRKTKRGVSDADKARVIELLEAGTGKKEIAAMTGVGWRTVYRIAKGVK